VDARISAGRRGPRKAEKGRELAGANYRPRDRDLGEALDLALAVSPQPRSRVSLNLGTVSVGHFTRAKKAPRERGLSRRNVERENRTCGIDRHGEASRLAKIRIRAFREGLSEAGYRTPM